MSVSQQTSAKQEVVLKRESSAVDVVIAGAGIAGSALALALASSGFTVAVVDPGQQVLAPPPPRNLHEIETRVSALSPASVGLFERLGAWARVPAGFRSSFTAMCVWDADGSGCISFNANEIPILELGYIVENARITAALQAALERQASATMLFSRSVATFEYSAGGAVTVQLDRGDKIQAGLLVGADGARSAVRTLARIGSVEHDCRQSAIVCTVRTSAGHQNTARQNFLASGPLAFLPLKHFPGDHHCSIVWSADAARAQELIGLDDQAFRTELEVASERRLGNIEEISRRSAFALVQRHARRFSGDGIALIGDAAHSIHPLAGQGINLGLADVAALTDELLRARRRGRALADAAVLGRYNRRRIGQARLMLEAMRGFQTLFGRTEMPLRLLRNFGLTSVSHLAPLKRHLMRQALGL